MNKQVSGDPTLLDAVIKEKSIFPIGTFLKTKLQKPLLISDSIGIIHFRNIPKNYLLQLRIEENCIHFPEEVYPATYKYCQDIRCLLYGIGTDKLDAVIIICDISPEELDGIKPHLETVSPPVRVYFDRLAEIREIEINYKSQLLEDILSKYNSNIRGLVKHLTNPDMDPNKLYFVILLKPDGNVTMDSLFTYSQEWLTLNKLGVVHCTWREGMLIMLGTMQYFEQTLEADMGWNNCLAIINRWKHSIENKFNINSSVGVGKRYRLYDLHRSYQEAIIAINISNLLGHQQKLSHYLDLGLFSHLFSLDKNALIQFCQQQLSPLINCDQNGNHEMLTTLRGLFDTNMNLNEAASNLYVHANTLRYRIAKIESILGKDLNSIETQFNLFAAIKIWDLLHECGFIYDQ